MQILRSLVFNLAFFGGTTIWLLVMMPFLLMPPGVMTWGVMVWATYLRFCLRSIVGLDHEERGREHLPPEPFVLACKHQSAWETIIFLLLFREPAYVLKKELRGVPLWGLYSEKYGNIEVDREAGASALKKMVADVLATLGGGRTVVIFPEGTRVSPGEKLPYHPGIAAIYSRTDLPVVPAALNSGLYWGRRSFIKKPGRIILEYLEPMPKGLDRRAFMAELEGRIEAATERLIKEAQETR